MNIKDKEIEKKIKNLLIWHFIWSKYYYSKIKYGNFISLIIFIPLLVSINFKIIMNKIINNEEDLKKYKKRLDGLIASIKGKKSYLRL